jgi:hypothetical protein
MALSIFEDKSNQPDDSFLKDALGVTYELWSDIKKFVFQNFPATVEEWKHSGKNYGWGFRLKDKKRVIVYLTPGNKSFLLSLVLGEKATKEALNSKISGEMKAAIETAPVYAEGRGFRIEIKNNKWIKDLKKLILIKLSN